MAIPRKQALKELAGKERQVERHIVKLQASPQHSSRTKWKNEVLGWLLQMEEVLRHVGKKTAAEWQARIDAYRADLEGAAPAQ